MSDLRFDTRLKGNGSSVSFIEIPKKVMRSFDGRIRVKVKASLNGYSYRTTITLMGGICFIPVRREVRENAGLSRGGRVQVVLEEDLKKRNVTVPRDLLQALKGSKQAHSRFKKLSYTHRKEYVTLVTGAKKKETRANRIGKILEALRSE